MNEVLVRNTIHLSLLFYTVALTLRLWLSPVDWCPRLLRARLARLFWTMAWAAYLLHVTAAFHFAHDWSHAAAVEHTRAISGVGAGIFVNYCFTLVWTADVISWWSWPRWYASRSAWIDRTLHGFMLFITFNATIVFATGLSRWAGAALFAWLASVALIRRWC